VSGDASIEIECPECDGDGCGSCDGGMFTLVECPRKFVPQEIFAAINMSTLAEKGLLPVAGGLLDQSSWYMELMHAMNSECAKVDAERAERMGHHGR
jgi:hypothetical protein